MSVDWAEKDRNEAKQLTDRFIEKVNADHDDVISFNRDIGCQIRNHIELLRSQSAALRETVANLSSRCESLPAQILEAMGSFSDYPISTENALEFLRQKRQHNEIWEVAALEKIVELKADLARERELNQELQQVVIDMRSLIDGAMDIGFFSNARAASLVVKADLLLEPLPADTGEK